MMCLVEVCVTNLCGESSALNGHGDLLMPDGLGVRALSCADSPLPRTICVERMIPVLSR